MVATTAVVMAFGVIRMAQRISRRLHRLAQALSASRVRLQQSLPARRSLQAVNALRWALQRLHRLVHSQLLQAEYKALPLTSAHLARLQQQPSVYSLVQRRLQQQVLSQLVQPLSRMVQPLSRQLHRLRRLVKELRGAKRPLPQAAQSQHQRNEFKVTQQPSVQQALWLHRVNESVLVQQISQQTLRLLRQLIPSYADRSRLPHPQHLQRQQETSNQELRRSSQQVPSQPLVEKSGNQNPTPRQATRNKQQRARVGQSKEMRPQHGHQHPKPRPHTQNKPAPLRAGKKLHR